MRPLLTCTGLLCLLLTQSCANNEDPYSSRDQVITTDGFFIGSGTGTTFVEGEVGLGSTTITEGGSTSVTVNIVDNSDLPANVTGNVVFSSNCVTTSDASFSSATVAIASGTATTTYNDISCSTDTITATATLDSGETLVANGGISIIPVTKIGSGSGTGFTEGSITLSTTSIVPGGTANISVNIVDATNTLVTSLQTVTFSSTCSNTSLASFTPATNSSASGTISTFYTDNGCIGTDFITATLSAGNTSIIATGSIDITPLQIGTGSGTGFVAGDISLTPTSISEGETTDISVNVVDSTGTLYTTPVTVQFSSTCATASPATASFTNTTVATVSGVATTRYQDQGCPSDTITATIDTVSAIDPTASNTITITPLRIGTGSGTSFVNSTLTLGLTTLSSGGTTSVSASVVDAADQLITTPVAVDFSSNCVTQGFSTFDTDSTTTINGVANVTYTAGGSCSGDDTITAIINPFSNNQRSATANVTIASPTPGSIEFTSTENNVIALAGAGATSTLSETTVVTFTVVDGAGNPLSGANVTFSLNTTLGGITLTPSTDTSDSNGEVQTIVQSGSVATSARVTATVDTTSLSTQSTAIVISTGLPHQDSISLSASELNPRAWNHDNVQVTITALLADRFKNPIQDGTNINFTTELGAIDSSCITTNGACSVTWRSQDPRGTSGPGSNAGRTTILAHVVGEESFNDVDGNGVYSDTDGNLAGGAFTDLPEPFVDENEDGIRQDAVGASEPYKDFNTNGSYDTADTQFNGVGCIHSTECGTNQTTFVRKSIVLVMSEDGAAIVKVTGADSDCDETVTPGDCSTTANYPSVIDVTTGSRTINFTFVGDTNYQVLPVGSTITFEVDNGKIVGADTYTVLNTNSNTYDLLGNPSNLGVATYPITIAADTTPSEDGSLTIQVQSGTDGPVWNFTPIAIDDLP